MRYLELGEELAKLRSERGYTQSRLAEKTGISRATINALENGRASDIGTRKLIKLLDILGYELKIRERGALPTFEELRDEH